jgi:4-hydroxy-tetrahydrodipicolinate synthase
LRTIAPGVYAITATPFDEDGRLDEGSLAPLVEFEVKAGVHGLVILGIMGESHKLADRERLRVTEAVLRHVAGRIPVVVGTTHGGTDPTIELSKAAEQAGAAAVMVAPPVGLKSPEGIIAHYRAVAFALQIPVVVQDEPTTTRVPLPPVMLNRIAREVESCRIFKLEDPPSPSKITQLRKLCGDSVQLYGGLGGAYFYEELVRGADGTMTGFAFPEILVGIYERFRAGRRAAAAALFDRYASLIRYESQQGIGLAIRKEILRRRGAIRCASVRAPGSAIDEVTLRELDGMLERMGLEAGPAPVRLE